MTHFRHAAIAAALIAGATAANAQTMVVNDRVVLVDPVTGEVVAELID